MVNAIDVLAAPYDVDLRAVETGIGLDAFKNSVRIFYGAGFTDRLEQQSRSVIELKDEVVHIVVVDFCVGRAQALIRLAGRIG